MTTTRPSEQKSDAEKREEKASSPQSTTAQVVSSLPNRIIKIGILDQGGLSKFVRDENKECEHNYYENFADGPIGKGKNEYDEFYTSRVAVPDSEENEVVTVQWKVSKDPYGSYTDRNSQPQFEDCDYVLCFLDVNDKNELDSFIWYKEYQLTIGQLEKTSASHPNLEPAERFLFVALNLEDESAIAEAFEKAGGNSEINYIDPEFIHLDPRKEFTEQVVREIPLFARMEANDISSDKAEEIMDARRWLGIFSGGWNNLSVPAELLRINLAARIEKAGGVIVSDSASEKKASAAAPQAATADENSNAPNTASKGLEKP